jgi:(2Fe-2S) ferredoxin
VRFDRSPPYPAELAFSPVTRRFVLVCQGPDCKIQGSTEVLLQFRAALKNPPPRGEAFVLPYQCFDRCGLGPNVVIYPDGIWYEGVGADDVEAIVRQLAGGTVPVRLLGDVSQEHAETYYRLFEDVLPELQAEEKKAAGPRRRGWWPF